MARIFITGSADGLGQADSRHLVAVGHDVGLHVRNRDRARQALRAVPGGRKAVEGDLASIEQTRELARQANETGPFQAVIHNAGIGVDGPRRETVDGLDDIFAINALAAFLLTALIQGPRRLIYMTSGLRQGRNAEMRDLQGLQRRVNGSQAYADSKLFELVLAFAVARLWPHVLSNAVDPGWVRTQMVGPSAPGGRAEGSAPQVGLAG